MTWSGVCLRAIVSVIPPVSIVGHEYSHSHWTTFRGPNQLHYIKTLVRLTVKRQEGPFRHPVLMRQLAGIQG